MDKIKSIEIESTPERCCATCAFWERPLLARLFRVEIGQCEMLEDRTWKSYVCAMHVRRDE